MDKTHTPTIEGWGRTFTAGDLTMNGTNYVSGSKVDTAIWPAVIF